MFNLFKSFSAKKILLFCGIILLLMIGVIILYIYRLLPETAFTIIFFLLIIVFSSLTSTLVNRRIEKKMYDKKKSEVYSVTGDLEFSRSLKTLKANFGTIDLYLENKVLYVLIKVNDADIFFSEEQQQVKYNVDKNKYDKLIQFYIFDEKDYNYFRKISIVNYQSKNFYVGSFIYDELDKTIYQSDNVARNDEYKEIYDNFFELLNIKKGQK